jgi:diaminohydroxyphosphoribosylaminopyrimidine deaminase / 5-amino-6-(5-phosphoribosylamino)uracil reductase
MLQQNLDQKYMSLALAEAKKGLGFTNPNPMVGAVIVKNNQILATGYHKTFGENHAEIDAILKLNPAQLKDATMYVTLEPCCHHGKTPPCTDTIIKSGIKEVVIASLDEDHRVKNKSVKILEKAGIKIRTGILEKEAQALNYIYFFNKKNKRPYIILKTALTLDGKIATHTGLSKWISNEKCRTIAHQLRAQVSAIVVGRHTWEKDQPRLNCRLPGFEKKPIKKIIFSNLPLYRIERGRKHEVPEGVSVSSPSDFLAYCQTHQIDSVLVEGGGQVYTWFLENNLVDHIYLFYKPSFLGTDGIPAFTKTGIDTIPQLNEFKVVQTQIIENNILVELASSLPLKQK